MNFELSRRFKATDSVDEVLNFLDATFRKNAETVSANPNGILQVKDVNATFGSINRTDSTIVEVKEMNDDILIVANVSYKPSVWFWIFFICGLFTTVAWLIPLGFYFYQKGVVKTGVEEILNRTENEFRENSGSTLQTPSSYSATTQAKTQKIAPVDPAAQIEKLGALMEKGLLSKEEFEAQKAKLLGIS